MNPGGIRSDVDAGDITYGEAFSVQPFSNIVTTKAYTGAQIDTILEQQFTVNSGATAGSARSTILQPSAGFTYTWSASAPLGSKVDPASIMLDGVMIDPAATYRITMNNFLGSGGDDFPVLRDGTDEVTGSDDLVALVEYLGRQQPLLTSARQPHHPTPLNQDGVSDRGPCAHDRPHGHVTPAASITSAELASSASNSRTRGITSVP